MDFYIIRHGRTNLNGQGILIGSSDLDLKDKNDPEVLKWVGYLKKTKFKYMVHSGMKRTEQTLNILKTHFAKDIISGSDNRLKELNFGEWELRSYDWLYQNSREIFLKWVDDPYNYPPPNGETVYQLKRRLFSFFEEWSGKNAEGSILVVTHGGPIRLLWSTINKTSFYEKKVPPATLFYLNWEEKKMIEIVK